jgi:hypothetical protein
MGEVLNSAVNSNRYQFNQKDHSSDK